MPALLRKMRRIVVVVTTIRPFQDELRPRSRCRYPVVSHPWADEVSVENNASPGFREFDDGLLLRGGVGTGNQTISFGVQDADLSHHEITVAPNTSVEVYAYPSYPMIPACHSAVTVPSQSSAGGLRLRKRHRSR